MIKTPLSALPDHSRAWIFTAARPLDAAESARLDEQVRGFVEGWLAHGHPVVGGYELRDDRFLVIAADEEATGVSGCSIDSLFRALKELERSLGVPLLDSSRVSYRDDDGGIRSVTRAEFRALAEAGAVGPETVVFDNTVDTLGGVRGGGWERPLRESWHARAFGRALSA